MGGYAWVTLATNNSYSLGALVLAHSLKKAKTAHNLAVLITPAVSASMRDQLQTVFDVVKIVDVLDSKDEAHLALLKRPDLGITFTKIHCWRLIEFEKCVFLDADTLVVRNCDELFEREEFSAAPDVSWPDCFNSGVFVYRPSIETFNELLKFAVENRSFDGGDQGLLNQYFSEWATEDIKKHLPFIYNLTSVAAYSYIPAFKHYGAETRIVHFIGTGKPWLQQLDASTRTVSPTSGSEHLTPLLQQWWDLFCEKVHPNLDKNLESSNDGMSHSPVEACSNPLPIALTDESQTPRLVEPCTPYREKDDFRQYNLPYKPFDVKSSSGELLNENFLLVPVASLTAPVVNLEEQQGREEDKMEEKNKKLGLREGEVKKNDEGLENKENNNNMNRENRTIQKPEKTDEEKKVDEEKKIDEVRKVDEEKKADEEKMADEEKAVDEEKMTDEKKKTDEVRNVDEEKKTEVEKKTDEEKNAKNEKNTDEDKKITEEKKSEGEDEKDFEQEEPSPPKNPFEYNSFFPDEVCINNYLEKNVETYQPFDNHHHHHHHHYHHHHHQKHHQHRQHLYPLDNCKESYSRNDNQDAQKSIASLPRFLTLPENDRRQSGNAEIQSPEKDSQPPKELPKTDFPIDKNEIPPEEQTIARNNIQSESIAEKRELTKSESMPYLPCDVTITEPLPPSSRSIWKSQPDVNADFIRRYSMPKLKPILPKQNSFSKSIPSSMPKVTQYTEFLMSSEYKDPIDLPKDKVGFVETHIHKEEKLRRSKSDVDIRSKFGPLPYAFSPEAEEPIIPKKIPFQYLENELYDLTQCKRQLGNKPKPKDAAHRKENVSSLPVLRPIVPAKDKKPAVMKKRKSKKLSPTDGGREKILKQDPEIMRERKRMSKPTPRNVSTDTNRNDLDEILNRLREFSKNYQHFFGVITETKKKTVTCKNALMNASEQDAGECTSSDAFKALNLPVSTGSKESQTGEEVPRGSTAENTEFRQFRNYIKDQTEASQKGLLSLQEILSDSVKKGREDLKFYPTGVAENEVENGSDSLKKIVSHIKEGNESLKLAEEYSSVKAQGILVYSKRNYSSHPSSFKSTDCGNGIQTKPYVLKHFSLSTSSADLLAQKLTACNSSCEKSAINSLNGTKGVSLSPSVLQESNNVEGNGNIEKTMQSQSKPCDIVSTLSDEIKESTKSDDVAPVHFKEQREQQINTIEKANIVMNKKKSPRKHKNNSEGSVLKEMKANKNITNDEQADVVYSKKCVSENGVAAAVQDTIASETGNFPKLNGIINAELRQEDVLSSGLRKQEREKQRESFRRDAHCNVTTAKPNILSKYQEMNRDSLSSTLEQKDKEDAAVNDFSESTLPTCRNNKQCNDNNSGNLDPRAVNKAIVSVVISSTTLQNEQAGDVLSKKNEKTKLGSKEEKDIEKLEQELEASKDLPFSATREKGIEEYKKREDRLYEPDLAKPRSFRVTLAKGTASSLVEEMITKAVCESDDRFRRSAPPTFLRSTPRKAQKSQPNPIKVSENGFKNGNRFSILSNGSPDETARVTHRKICDKKSKRKTPSFPSPSSPQNGNSQPDKPEDLKNTSGIAGAIAQLSLESGSDQSAQSTDASIAHQEYLRRQNWETGNIDYMGRDSFDNIWSKICQTIEAKESDEAGAAAATAESPKEPTQTSVITEEKGKFKETAAAGNTVSSVLQKCPDYIEILPDEPTVGPVEDDEIIFSKFENKQPCLTNVTEEDEVEAEGSASSTSLLTAGSVKLSDILHSDSISEAGIIQAESSTECEKPQVVMSTEGPKKENNRETEGQVEVSSRGENKKLSETPSAGSLLTKPSAPLAEEKSELAALPTDTACCPQPSALEKPECKTVAICQPSVPLSQMPPAGEQNQSETPAKITNLEKKAEECKTVAIPSPPITFPGAPFIEKGKKQPKTNKVKENLNVKSEPIPLPPPDSPTLAPMQESSDKTSRSDSLKDEGKQKKGVFTKILEIVGVAPKEKNESEISKSVFYDIEGSAFSTQEINNRASAIKESETLSGELAPTAEDETAHSAGEIQVIEDAIKLQAKEAEQEKAMVPAESEKVKDLSTSESEEMKSEIIPELTPAASTPEMKEHHKNQEQKLQEEKHLDKSEEQKPPTQEVEKPRATEGVKSKRQSKQQKSNRASMPKPARNSSPKELKKPADSDSQASVSKRKSPSPKVTIPQNPTETEITVSTPTSPSHPDVSPRRNSALLKVDDSILDTPPVPESVKEGIDEAVKGKASAEIDIMEKAKSEVESLLQDHRNAEIEEGESSDLINAMKLMMAEKQIVKAEEEVEELRVTSEEERKQHKGETVSSKLSDQILKAIPPPRRKAISEASASTSAIPKAPAAPEQKNPSTEGKTKASKSSSIPVPPPRSRGKATPPTPPKGKGKK